ncbi:DUF3093 domain-containing protein [Rhodococcus sp. D2-41]|uniref:DUF3093 domain-containing protein n=1 Tax=Speluncibacter jeojiensis TaxID=2710754 RepID=A0A9X4M3P8_9ACTN|nr:DUF3093 domain-containing protein [Rhodococcus sp. D2-41]MDG3011402.1 DUF3093 domain-containing protein [Rhodococcus sp. D2-41]MDG3016586.1 DUF3093 domain-containing protein [Corynebacteriales bacterium D3-21]
MSEHAQPAPTADATARTVFSERLWVPIWWWVAGVVVAELLAVEVHMSARSVPWWIPGIVLLPFVAWACLWMGRLRLEVVVDGDGEGEFRIGRAHLPLDVISRTFEVPEEARSAALGRQLDPAAFVQNRSWVKTMVLIILDDPQDPTPYWLVSTRKPAELAAALAPRSQSPQTGTAQP